MLFAHGGLEPLPFVAVSLTGSSSWNSLLIFPLRDWVDYEERLIVFEHGSGFLICNLSTIVQIDFIF